MPERAGVPLRKRAFDLLLTIPILVLLSPFFLILGILVRWRLGSPVLFTQQRPGLGGSLFELYKFRSMRNLYSTTGDLLPDEQRITPFGRFLRSTSLDELPELWNVLRGEMSLVGPRPLLMQYLDRYTPRQARRHEVLPGITGWAQIHGRNVLAWDEKFELDVWYVENWSTWLDIRILALTLWKVIQREGISQPGHTSAPEYMGPSGMDDDG
jgi:lipopolysaccharide/colanic/teichoic acid biosynthesis glycosyltransferase